MKTRGINTILDKKILSYFFVMFFVLSFFILPGVSFSAEPTGYTLLTPLPLGPGGSKLEVVPLGEASFGDYLNNFFKLGITIASILAVIMIVIGGIQYMGGDSVFSKEEAKSKITNSIFGLILALGIWLLLYTINPDMLNLKLKIAEIAPTPATPTTPTTPSPGITSLGRWTEALAQSVVDDDNNVRLQLLQNSNSQVLVKPNKCTMNDYRSWVSGGNATGGANCTTVGKLGGAAINGLAKLSKDCGGCSFVVSGGTEWGHSANGNHFPSSSGIDIRTGSAVDSYIRSKGVRGDNTSLLGRSISIYIFTYADFYEEDLAHWHVVFK